MAKSLGAPKTGGRKKGTPNKRTLAFAETLNARGINLLEEILDAAKALPRAERVKVYLDLMPYQYPKRKATEQAPFVFAEYIEGLAPRELAALAREIEGRVEATVTPEEKEAKVREVVRIAKILEELEDDPDCQEN